MRTILIISVCAFACDQPAHKMDTEVNSDVDILQWGLSNQPDWMSTESAYATGLAFIDIDRDGDMDLIVAEGNDMEPGLLRVYENQAGELETTASWTSQEPQYYGHLAVGDINGDGWTDVVVSRFLGENRFESPGGVEVFLNTEGFLSQTPDWEDSGIFSFSLSLGDIDLDGDLDMVVCGGDSYFHDPEPSRLYENDGSGNFIESMQFDAAYRMDAAFADLDNDGWLDLMFAEQGRSHTVHYNQRPGFSAVADVSLIGDDFEGNTIDWGDVNGDGYFDVLVSDNDQQGGGGWISLWCGPDLSPCWQSNDASSMRSAVSLHDVDADGDLDLISGAWWGPVLLYENQNGTLAELPIWVNDHENMVIEAFAWGDRDSSHEAIWELSGERLLHVPRHARLIASTGGVLGDGYFSGAGDISVTLGVSKRQDLAVSDWEPSQGNVLFPIQAIDSN